MLRRFVFLGALLGFGATALPASAQMLDGRASLNGQNAVLAPALGFWTETGNRVSLAFFTTAPSEAQRKASRDAGEWDVRGTGPTVESGAVMGLLEGQGPAYSLRLPFSVPFANLAPTATAASAPIAFNVNSAARCGLTSPAGDPKAGGTFAARLKGEAPGPNNRPFSWDVAFHLPIAR
jgi:hypothetical protein